MAQASLFNPAAYPVDGPRHTQGIGAEAPQPIPSAIKFLPARSVPGEATIASAHPLSNHRSAEPIEPRRVNAYNKREPADRGRDQVAPPLEEGGRAHGKLWFGRLHGVKRGPARTSTGGSFGCPATIHGTEPRGTAGEVVTATRRGIQTVTWNRNSSTLFACKWLRAPDFNPRPVAARSRGPSYATDLEGEALCQRRWWPQGDPYGGGPRAYIRGNRLRRPALATARP